MKTMTSFPDSDYSDYSDSFLHRSVRTVTMSQSPNGPNDTRFNQVINQSNVILSLHNNGPDAEVTSPLSSNFPHDNNNITNISSQETRDFNNDKC